MNALANTVNPFAQSRRESNAVAESAQTKAVADIQSAMVIAKRFPRDQVAAMDRILQSCTRPSLAESALYSYSRGGTEITGPSIRLAEALAQNWGNLEFGIRELSQANGESTVEAFAFDLETNTRQVKVFQVPHSRYTRSGTKKLEDPRDIYELVANQGARRLRACILGIIPGDVVDAAVNQCEVTLHTSADVSPERVKAMLDAFKTHYGITQDMIQKRIGRRVDAINAPLIVQLKKIYQSLKDGMSQPSDWFEAADSETVNKAKWNTITLASLKGAPEPAPNTEQIDTTTGEILPQAEDEPDRYLDLKLALSECKSQSDITRLVHDLTKEQKQDGVLVGLVRTREAELKNQ